jgi:endonuclease
MKRFNVVLGREDGAVEVHPMKQWLRQHPDELPSGVDATEATSHQLRNILKKRGWLVEELATEVRLFPANTSAGAAAQVLGDGEASAFTEDEDPLAFALEAQLRDFLAHNLPNIPIAGQSLQLFRPDDGKTAVEYSTGVGFIDLLAQDRQGDLYVFELKLDRGPDRALGQLLRYMGWVKVHLSPERTVHGVIVARSVDEKLRYASSVIPNVTLLEYEVSFTVREAPVPVGADTRRSAE